MEVYRANMPPPEVMDVESEIKALKSQLKELTHTINKMALEFSRQKEYTNQGILYTSNHLIEIEGKLNAMSNRVDDRGYYLCIK